MSLRMKFEFYKLNIVIKQFSNGPSCLVRDGDICTRFIASQLQDIILRSRALICYQFLTRESLKLCSDLVLGVEFVIIYWELLG